MSNALRTRSRVHKPSFGRAAAEGAAAAVPPPSPSSSRQLLQEAVEEEAPDAGMISVSREHLSGAVSGTLGTLMDGLVAELVVQMQKRLDSLEEAVLEVSGVAKQQLESLDKHDDALHKLGKRLRALDEEVGAFMDGAEAAAKQERVERTEQLERALRERSPVAPTHLD